MGQKAKGEKLDEHTIESIGERFRQAARTAYRLPAVRVQGYRGEGTRVCIVVNLQIVSHSYIELHKEMRF